MNNIIVITIYRFTSSFSKIMFSPLDYIRKRKICVFIYICLISIPLQNLLDAQWIQNVKVLSGVKYGRTEF